MSNQACATAQMAAATPMSPTAKFYIVWVEGSPATGTRHTELKNAKEEAARHSENTGKPAYVLGFEGVAFVRKEPVVYIEQGGDLNEGDEEILREATQRVNYDSIQRFWAERQRMNDAMRQVSPGLMRPSFPAVSPLYPGWVGNDETIGGDNILWKAAIK